MATNKALKFIKVNHFSSGTTVNEKFTSALATEAAIIYTPDVHEIWIGGANANAAVCVVKGTSNVAFDSDTKQLTITTTTTGQESIQTLDFKDVASAEGVFKVFENVYNLMGATTSGATKVIDYSGTTYIKAGTGTSGQTGYIAPSNNQTLADADRILDANIKRIDDAIGGNSVVNSIDGVSGTILVGNGLNVDVVGETGSETKTLNIIPETDGYIVTSQSVGGTDKTGINIANSKIDSTYITNDTVNTATNLATVATVTAGLATLDVASFAQASLNTTVGSGVSTLTVNGISETDGKIATDSTTNKLDISIDGEYNTSGNKIATQSTVTNAIDALDVTEYAQASVANNNLSFTIKAIKEIDGKIAAGTTTSNDLTLAFENAYNATDSKIATKTTVTNAINALDVTEYKQGSVSNSALTIKGISEADGKIAVGTNTDNDIIVNFDGSYDGNSNKVATVSTVTGAIAGLNGSHTVTAGVVDYSGSTQGAAATKEIVFKGATETAGIVSTNNNADATLYFTSAPTDTDPLVVKSDLSGIVGAMVYKGVVNSNNDLPTASTSGVIPGWTYVVATAGTYAGKNCEVGDMIIVKSVTTEPASIEFNVINGENQVTNNNANITAGAASGSETTIATVDGVEIKARVSVTGGNATIASISNNVVTLKAGVTQTETTGTIGNNSASDIILEEVAVTGAAADVSIADTDGLIEATTVEGALTEIATEIDAMDVTGYAQATIAAASGETPTTSVLTIKGISETDGKIAADTDHNLVVHVDGVYNSSTNMIATQDTVTNAIGTLDAELDADQTTAETGKVVPSLVTPTADFKVLNSVTETDGKLSAGTAYNVKKLAATAAATDMTVTSAVYGTGSTTTNAQEAFTNLASAISSAAITIDGHVGAITTGNGLTDVAGDGGSFGIKIDNTNAHGLYLEGSTEGSKTLAMHIADESTASGANFGTVKVTNGNGLSISSGVVSYAHNTTAITVASKNTTTNVITINGTLTPDASDAISTSNAITLASVAATGTAADVAIVDSGNNFTAENVEGALAEIADEIDAMDAVVDSTKTTIDDNTAREAQNGGVFALQAITETDGKITAMTAVEVEAAGTTATAIAGLDASVQNYTSTTSGDVTTITYDNNNNVAVSVTEADGKLTGVTANLYWDIYE